MITIGSNTACGPDRLLVGSRFAHTALQFVDVHCHCLPNLDDGPESMEEALTLCRRLVQDNVSTVVATPHQLGRFEDYTHAQAIRRTTGLLNGALKEQGIDLQVLPGAEVRLDERVDELLAQDKILTLADAGRHVLLELPWDVLIDIEPLLVQLACRGVHVILAHPERNVPLLRHLPILRRWLACGVGLQVTAGSLMGDWGRRVKRAAWQLVMQGCRICVATDAHGGESTSPRMMEAFRALADRLGRDGARLLCVENPARVIRGEKLALVLAPSQQEVT
jgi:protein-tyrosine phosphatase